MALKAQSGILIDGRDLKTGLWALRSLNRASAGTVARAAMAAETRAPPE